MKKSILILTLLVSSLYAGAQDTTSLQLIGLNGDDETITFYNHDTLNFANGQSFNTYAVMALFQNPADSSLIALMDILDNGDRDFYTLDPLTGATSLFFETSQNYYASADIADNGKIYAITGNAHNSQGAIYEIDPINNTEVLLHNSSAIQNVSRAIEYIPTSNSLYIYQESTGVLEKFNLGTETSTTTGVTGLNQEIHGIFFNPENEEMIISHYAEDHLVLTAPYNSPYKSVQNTTVIMDMANIDYISSTSDTMSICSGNAVTITYRYGDAQNLTWLKDGVVFSSNSLTLSTSQAGTYHALYEVETGKFLKSEPIVIENATTPNVNISEANNATEICPNNNETLTLTGANGGTLQWFRNGVAIAGANANTYIVTQAGIYNQLKTNLSGCADSAAVGYTINLTAGCTNTIGINDVNTQELKLYPNPISDNGLHIKTDKKINSIQLVDLSGKVIYLEEHKNIDYIDFSNFQRGMYLIQIQFADNSEVHQKIKY